MTADPHATLSPVTQPAASWVIDPDDPRAPPTDIWKRMTEQQRAEVIASLPSEFSASESMPPEGDDHLDAFTGARDALRRWFRDRGRNIYIAGDLPVYYPGERMFSPDLIAVDGAEQRQRDSWIVDAEGGKGLDVAIEIVVRGDRKKDLERNVERYARLGIPEYYLVDRRHMTLVAWELEGGIYRRRVAQGGRFRSQVLELDLWIDGDRLRFSVGDAAVPYADELIERITRLSNEAQDRVERLESELAEESSAAKKNRDAARPPRPRLRDSGRKWKSFEAAGGERRDVSLADLHVSVRPIRMDIPSTQGIAAHGTRQRADIRGASWRRQPACCGNVISSRAPFAPSTNAACPPWISAMCRTRARPSPWPARARACGSR